MSSKKRAKSQSDRNADNFSFQDDSVHAGEGSQTLDDFRKYLDENLTDAGADFAEKLIFYSFLNKDFFEQTWQSLEPVNVTLEELNFFPPEYGNVFSSENQVKLYQFPIHCFFEEWVHTAKQIKQIGDVKFKIKWTIFFPHSDLIQQALMYKINFLYVRPLLLKSRQTFPTIIEIDDLKEVAEAIGAGDEIDEKSTYEAIRLLASIAVETEIVEFRPDDSEKVATKGFRIFDTWATRGEGPSGGADVSNSTSADANEDAENIGKIRIKISDSYLKILARSPLIDFDYAYLKQFHAVEIRLYELLSYWRYRPGQEPLDQIKIKYLDLVRLAPLPKCRNLEEMKELLETVLSNFLQIGWIKEITIEPSGIGSHSNSKITVKF